MAHQSTLWRESSHLLYSIWSGRLRSLRQRRNFWRRKQLRFKFVKKFWKCSSFTSLFFRQVHVRAVHVWFVCVGSRVCRSLQSTQQFIRWVYKRCTVICENKSRVFLQLQVESQLKIPEKWLVRCVPLDGQKVRVHYKMLKLTSALYLQGVKLQMRNLFFITFKLIWSSNLEKTEHSISFISDMACLRSKYTIQFSHSNI